MKRKESILSSRLNRRIQLQKEILTPDGAGGYSSSWQAVATVWAAKHHVRGKERLRHQQVLSQDVVEFTIRYRDDVTTSMRILYDGSFYNLLAINDVCDAHQTLELVTQEQI